MSDVAIRAPATGTAPRDYTIPGAQELLPKSVAASMDGTSASTTWYPALQFLDPGGNVMVTAVSPTAFAAGASVDVSWFPHLAPQTAVAQSSGVIVDQFLVDSKTSTGAAGSVNLTSGVSYLVTAQGTYSLWNSALEVGTPNADAIFPSATGGRASLQVGLDPECSFAYHDEGTGFTLGHETFWQFNNGAGFVYTTPQGGPFATPQTNYLYRYTIVGTGVPLSAKVNEAGSYSDNYGKIQVTVYSTSGSGTGGGGGSLVPPDGSDHSILRVESGIPGWEARPNIVEADLSLSDNTTANAATTQHGLLPKLDNNSAHFLDGTGAWATPAGSTPLTTKGDLYGHSTVDARIPVGSDNQVLIADSAQTLGVKWGAAPAGSGGALTLLASSVLSSAAASFDFTSISGGYSALMLEMLLRGATGAGTFERVGVRFNNDSTANHYGWAFFGSSTASNAMTDTWIQLADAAGNGATAGQFGGYVAHIPFYADSTHDKMITGSSFSSRLATGIFANSGGGLWNSSAAITRITILPATNVGGNWATGSAVSIYGVS